MASQIVKQGQVVFSIGKCVWDQRNKKWLQINTHEEIHDTFDFSPEATQSSRGPYNMSAGHETRVGFSLP